MPRAKTGPWKLALSRLRARRLALGHAEALQALVGRAADYFQRAEGRAPDRGAGLAMLSDALADRERLFFGFEGSQGGDLLGLLDLRLRHPGPLELSVTLLLFAPEARRQGYGAEVVAALAEAARERGMAAVHLGVREGERDAHAFWRAQGFVASRREGGVTNYELAL